MDAFYFSTAAIGALVVVLFLYMIFSGSGWKVFSPIGVVLLCYVYYCVVGPWVYHLDYSMAFLDVSFYDGIEMAAIMALVSFMSLLVSFLIFDRRLKLSSLVNDISFCRSGVICYAIFYFLFIASLKFNFIGAYNVFGKQTLDESSASVDFLGFEKYFYLINSGCIACLVVIFSRALRKGKWVLFSVLTLNFTLMVLATGFRFRIAFLALALASFYAIHSMAKPDWSSKRFYFLVKCSLFLGFFLSLLVLMSTARVYGEGISVDSLSDASASSMFSNLFNDSSIYFTTGLVGNYVVDFDAYTYFSTFGDMFLRIIPKALYGEKPIPVTVDIVGQSMGGSKIAYDSGFFMTYYGEWFMSFGWCGLVFISGFLGWFCAWMNTRMCLAVGKNSALVFCVFTGYVFVFFHRGYFPQVFECLAFMVLMPLFLINKLDNRESRLT